MSILGTRVVRVEDPRLLTAGATYVDDLTAPELTGAAYATFVRSPVAHARITSVDVAEALQAPGVVAVLTARDLDDIPGPGDQPIAEPLLAGEVVRYVGEAVAIVVTEERYQGEDAAELVAVDYETLPAVIGVEEALRDDTLLFPASGSNVVEGDGADGLDDAAFAGCEVVVDAEFTNQRVAPAPLEVRGAAAAWTQDRLILWSSTQNAQMSRDMVTGTLGLEPGTVRVITPDVGGGFGAKIGIDRDAIGVAWAARHLRRPLRWTETRSENMIAMTHGRAQRHRVKIGGTRDGRVLAYRLDLVQDCGAYVRLGTLMPTLTVLMAGGVYDIPTVQTAWRAVVTDTAPIGAYRGAGRPEATSAIERAIDMFAAEIGQDPAEVRRRNLIPPDRFPYTTPSGAVYDTGEYAKALDAVLEAGGYAGLRAEQARRRERGESVQLGLGLSTYVEITAGDAPDGETARLVVAADGTATVYTGSSAHGQGHDTAFSMLVNERLGIPMDKITVVHGDSDAIPKGVGTFGSRSLQLGGSAVNEAAGEVWDRARELAAARLEADPDDVVLTDDRWHVRGIPATALGWGELAQQAGPEGLVANAEFSSELPTFPFGAHLSVVEVDTETGKVRLLQHVTVDDAGTIVNPVLAEGQRHGGIAQGAAQAMLEEMVYDADGNPLTTTLADYAFVTAAELPSFELLESATPTTVNELGVKGIGEAGTIGSTPAVQNAVIDALAHLGIRHIDMPTTPERVWTAINERAAQ